MGRRLSEYCHKYWIWISKNQALSTLFWALHFLLVRSKIPTSGRLSGLPGARSPRFLKDLDFLAPENAKFCSPAGASLLTLVRIRSWLSKYCHINMGHGSHLED